MAKNPTKHVSGIINKNFIPLKKIEEGSFLSKNAYDSIVKNSVKDLKLETALDLNPKFQETFAEVKSTFDPELLRKKFISLSLFEKGGAEFLKQDIFTEDALLKRVSKKEILNAESAQKENILQKYKNPQYDNASGIIHGVTKEDVKREIACELNIFASILKNKL